MKTSALVFLHFLVNVFPKLYMVRVTPVSRFDRQSLLRSYCFDFLERGESCNATKKTKGMIAPFISAYFYCTAGIRKSDE